MADLPDVPKILSPEGRARMVGDIVNRVEYAGKPDARREAVELHALAHIRCALAMMAGPTSPREDEQWR